MKNIDLLFEKNKQGRNPQIKIHKNSVYYVSNCDIIDSREIRNILSLINYVRAKYTMVHGLSLVLKFKRKIKFSDKLTYIILETIFYNMLIEYGWHPKVEAPGFEPSILTSGFMDSCIKYLGARDYRPVDFIDNFSNHLLGRHFRRVIPGNTDLYSNELGKLMGDVDMFLNNLEINTDCRGELAEVVAELVGNSLEHTQSDCLLDIDVTGLNSKKGSLPNDPKYIGINVAILNYSTELLGTAISERIKHLNVSKDSSEERYLDLLKGYEKHVSFFDENYEEEHFYMVSCFQDRISGSLHKRSSGGRGLTMLIKSLEQRSEEHACYVLSGRKVVFFHKDLLNYDKNGWLGFNKVGFFEGQPEEIVCDKSAVFFPGTAFNLNFIMEESIYE